MKLALSLAKSAASFGEVPVGAVIVKEGSVLATGYNLRERTNDPTAHAEIIALRKAAAELGSWRLVDCDLYVTLEPCIMCMGALTWARARRIYYGAADPKGGAAGSLYALQEDTRLNHQIDVVGPVDPENCGKVLKDFFKARRKNKA